MCGIEDLIAPVLDVAAAATGNAELIPLIQGGITAGEDVASGKGIGKSLLQGVESGGEALAGQEVAGAFGVGSGNTAVNNALGVDISPASTGLPDIGGGISNALGLGSNTSPTTGGDSAASVSSGGTGNSVSGASGAPVSGSSLTTGGTGGAVAAPTSIGASGAGGDVSADNSFLNNSYSTPSGSTGINSAASSNFTNAVSGSNFGSGTGGGLDTSGIGGGSSSGGTANFLAGSSDSAGGTNIGQGPTVSNAANLPSNTAPAGNSIVNAFNNPSVSTIGTALGSNAGVLTGLGGLASNIVEAQQVPKGQSQLISNAQNLNTLGQQNESYLASGTLPPGAQAGINQATQAAIAAIKSKYASMGDSGSSAEQQEIAYAQQQAQAQGEQIALQLMQQGASDVGMASNIYSEIMNNAMKSDQNFSSAFTNLATAVGGGGTTIRLGNQAQV